MRYKVLLLVLILVGTSLLILASTPKEVEAIPHDPIVIESDGDLEAMAAAEGWAGTGSAADPFIIEDYVIDANGTLNGILVRNIDHHIVIRNCVVFNTSNDVYIPSGDGIYLAQAENATIEGCEVYDCYDGIGLYDCKDIKVQGNLLHNNRGNGLDIGKCTRVQASGNTCENNSINGISLWLGSTMCQVDNNTCASSTTAGIGLNSAPNNTLADNVCQGNHDGIYVVSSSDGTVMARNNCSNNTGTGFLIQSDAVSLSGDEGTGNPIAIKLDSIADVRIEKVRLVGNSYALFASSVDDLAIYDGNFSNNLMPGIYLVSSSNISTSGNEIFANDHDGVYLDTCSNSAIGADLVGGNTANGVMMSQCVNVTAGPTCIGNGQNGLRMDDCVGCDVISGNMSSNANSGVRLSFCIDCTVSDCDLYDEVVGASIISSASTTVQGNRVIACGTGIYSESSTGGRMADNRLVSCTDGIWVFLSDGEMVTGNNVTGCDEDAIVVVNNADHCTVDGNEVGGSGNNGIYVSGCLGTNVTGNLVFGSVLHGIIVLNSPQTLVSENVISDVGQDGVRLVASDGCALVLNNVSGGGSRGIYAFSSDNGTISSNTIGTQSSAQISLDGCDGMIMHANQLQGGPHGIYILSSPNSTVSSGNISGASVAGVYLSNSNHSSIVQVRLSNCGVGINLNRSSDGEIVGNIIIGSLSHGVQLDECSGIWVYGNVLIDNNGAGEVYDAGHPQAYDSSPSANRWNSTGTPGDYGNLWSDWLTPDDDFDGIVDVPYVLATGAQDNSPLADGAAPELVVTYPQNLDALSVHDVLVQWSGWDNGSGIAGYALAFDGASTWVDMGLNTSYLWTSLEEGIHQIKVNATDRAGWYNVTTVLFYVDRTAPQVTILTPANNTFTDQPVAVVNWNGSDAITAVDHYDVRINAYPWTTTTDTTFTTPAMDEGSNQVWINATDVAGNWAIYYLQVFVDTQGPELEITSPVSGVLLANSTVDIIWTISDAGVGVAVCEISIDSGAWTNVTGLTSYELTGLSEGAHSVQLRASDELGNQRAVAISFGVDLFPPTVTIISPVNATSFTTGSVMMEWEWNDSSGFGIDRFEVQVDSGTWVDVGKNTSWTITGLLVGEHTLGVRASDNTGRNGTDAVVIFVDDSGPEVEILNIDEWQVLAVDQVNVTWSAFDTGSDLSRFEARLDDGAWEDRGLLTWAVFDLTEGNHTITVRGYDQLDNMGQDQVNFSVDLSPPTVVILYPTEGSLRNNRTVVVFYDVNDPSGIRWLNYTLDGVNWTRVNYPSDRLAFNTSDGPVHFTLKAVDLHGLQSSAWLNFTLDSTAPAVASYGPTGSNVRAGTAITVGLNEDIVPGSLRVFVDGLEQTYSTSGRNFSVNLALLLGHTYQVSVQSGSDAAGNVMGNFSWSFSTLAVGVVTGTVVDSDGDPVEGAYVRAGSYSVITDFQGNFLLSLPPGSYNLSISASGMEERTIPIEVDGDIDLGQVELGNSAPGADPWLIGGALAAIAAIGGVGYLVYRRRKK